MPLDLAAYWRAADAATLLIVEHGALGDPAAVERLADDYLAAQLDDPDALLIASELRARAEFMREHPAAS